MSLDSLHPHEAAQDGLKHEHSPYVSASLRPCTQHVSVRITLDCPVCMQMHSCALRGRPERKPEEGNDWESKQKGFVPGRLQGHRSQALQATDYEPENGD